MILSIAIFVFIALELANVVVMFFRPDFKYGNSMAVFKEWGRSRDSEGTSLFVRYLVNWVANCKLIFIILLAVIAILGSERVKAYGVGASIVSIGMYFVSLHPLIKRLDDMGEIVPKGYSRTLAVTIGGFMAMFTIALVAHFVVWP